ncbi:MAG: diaminopimelate epimerase [Pseudomonadota bacterium]|nr:diaminopimelate epimerase [Pseudomonadota bacterium]
MSLAGLPFRKMNGLGNDFVIVDLRDVDAEMTPDAARLIADRKTGVGCDQVITIEDRNGLFMGVWNADGSEVGACGNAARCVGWLLMEEFQTDEVDFATTASPLAARRAGARRVTVDMGAPKFGWRDIPLAEQFEDTRFIDIKLGPIDKPVLWGPSAVSMGNPHCIFFVDDAEAQALDRFGPMVENHPLFPERANVSVAQVKGEHLIRLRVWERGAGITKACGSAACAALVAANRRRLTARKATIELDGGQLGVEWGEDDHVRMTGPVAFEFDGVLPAGV